MQVGVLTSRLHGVADAVGDTTESQVRSAAQVIVNDIKDRAPVATGHLRNSYDYTIDDSGGETTAHIGSSVDYALYQEFGTSRMAAQPHVRPALEANKEAFYDMMRGSIEDAAGGV